MNTTTVKVGKKAKLIANGLTKNVIQLKNGFINLPKSTDGNTIYMTVVAELMQFGFLLETSAIEALSNASEADVITLHNELITYLKYITGSNRNYTPFWKDFPEEVMAKSEGELWLHQIVHYMSNGKYEPNEFTAERPTAFEQVNYAKINVGTEDDFLNVFTRLASVNQSLTPEDLETIIFFINSGHKLIFPNRIPFKENLTTIISELMISNREDLTYPKLTVTDVLRVAVGLSGGDVSLPKVPAKMVRINSWSRTLSVNEARNDFKFKKFKRSERKFILGLLESTNCDETEAVLKAQRWVRLGEILHPTEYESKYPNAAELFNKIRNEKVVSWYGKFNAAYNTSLTNALDVISERPGEFGRKLDFLIRDNIVETPTILSRFETVASKISNKVLYELYTHFAKRNVTTSGRSIMVKGRRQRTALKELEALSDATITSIQNTILKALTSKYAELPEMGKVYLDEELKKIPMPTNMRSTSEGLIPVIRGQRTPIGSDKTKVIRAFCHWFDENGNQDIDLTCTFIGMGKIDHIGWNGRHNSQELGTYSGDIRHRKGACAEYVDIKLDSALRAGYRYAIIDAHNYNGRSFETVTDCVVGYMERESATMNETFKPDTIANCTRLTNESSSTIVSVIDLETREAIHLDIDESGLPVTSNDFKGLLEAIKPYCEAPKFSVYDLLKLHAETRGTLVENKEDADVALVFEDFSTSYIKTLEYMGV